MKLGVVMGDIARVHPKKDTTLGLLDAARRRGWALSYFTPVDLWLQDGEVRGAARALDVRLGRERWFELGPARDAPLASLDAVLMRLDPPVDEAYIAACHMLEMAEGVLVVNDPAGVRAANEKMFAQRFAAFQPPTLMSLSLIHI